MGASWAIMTREAKHWGVLGRIILTNVGAAGVEQMLVHHGHTILERMSQCSEGNFSFSFPSAQI